MRRGLVGWMRRFLANPRVFLLIIIILLLVLFSHFFNAKPAGLSPAEFSTKNSSLSLSTIFHNPINASHNLLAYGLHAAGISWRGSIRLASTIFGGFFLACFYWLARLMFGKEIGLMGGLILLASPLFLVAARDGSGVIMYFWIIALMALYNWAARSESGIRLIILAAATALALYTPGIILWIVIGLALGRKKITAIIEDAEPPIITVAILIGLLLIVPLVLAIIKDESLAKQLFLIPATIAAPGRVLKNIAWAAYSLFVKAPHHSALIINRLPLFNWVADALLIFGSFAMWGAARDKFITLVAAIVYAVIFAGFNDNFSLLALAIPAASIIICAGLRYLYIEWRRVFPHNPLAKTMALSMMWVLVIVQLAFGARYALIAWPVTTDTHTTYVLK